MVHSRRHPDVLTAFAAMLLVSLWGSLSSAQESAESNEIAPLVEQFCSRCHGPETQSAGINLATLVTVRPLVRNRDTWNRVVGMLDMRRMPPPGAPQPSDAVRDEMLAILSREIHDFDYSTIDDPGFERMRRLTHDEYDNTVGDLFGVEINATDRFPDELTGSSGFENSSNTLFLQPSLMERYIAVAERIVELALPVEATTETHRRTRDLIFVATPGGGLGETEAAEVVLRRFLTRAYRRQSTDDEVIRAVDQYGSGRASGLGHEGAVKGVLQSALISPKFLLRVEAGRDGADPFPVGDWELASRLSYFFWASMPDDELFELAARGGLRDTLRGQVDRMLADPKADTLGTVFAAQWLGFRHVGTRIWLDPIDNPSCTATLMTAMRDESSLFFMSLLRDNLPIANLIDADYTYVNEELATTLYGMDGVEGDHMRQVSLDDPNRGGIIGQASKNASVKTEDDDGVTSWESVEQKRAMYAEVVRWNHRQVAYLLDRMKGIQEPNGGTLLDNSMIVYGASLGDGNEHDASDLPTLVAGRGGGTITTGRFLEFAEPTDLSSLHLSLLQRMGVPIDSFGTADGPLRELDG